MPLRPRFFENTTIAAGLKMLGIAVAACLLILTFLFVFYAGARRNTRGPRVSIPNIRDRARRNRDPETGADAADCDSESVDTLPRYTPGSEGCMAPAEQSHGNERDRVEEGERENPPPYTFDASGQTADAEDGDGHTEDHADFPASPAPAHFQS